MIIPSKKKLSLATRPSKDELDVHRISHRSSIGPDSWPKTEREQYIAQFPIVAPVTRRIESKQLRISFLIHVEVRREVVSLQRGRRRKRREKKLGWRWRITLAWSATGACAVGAACTSADSRPCSSTCAGARSRCACCSSSRARTGPGCRSQLSNGWWRGHRRRSHGRQRLGGNYRFRRDNLSRSISNRRLQFDEPQSIATRSTAAPTSSTRSPAANSRRTLEILPRYWKKDEQDDEQVRKKRGGDTLPPPLSLAWYPARRPVTLIYWAGASFGETPMTFTPAPRATSIA